MIVEVVRPETVREAVSARSRPGAAYLGGGTWLNSGRAEGVAILISLERLALDGIEAGAGGCTLGAMATLQGIVDAAEAPAGLRAAAALTASRTLRNMKTLGGELGLRSADSAIIPALLALDAAVLTAGRKRALPIADFLAALPGDLIISVTVPVRPCVVRALSRTAHGTRSLVVAVSAWGGDDAAARSASRRGEEADGQPADARVIAADCRGLRMRLTDIEALLVELRRAIAPLPARERIEEAVRAEFPAGGDAHASGAYKRYMAGVYVADALRGLTDGEGA
jgi:putative selenate reductase FAD-binding subunit